MCFESNMKAYICVKMKHFHVPCYLIIMHCKFQFRGSEILELHSFSPASVEDIASVHTKAYVSGLEKATLIKHVSSFPCKLINRKEFLQATSQIEKPTLDGALEIQIALVGRVEKSLEVYDLSLPNCVFLGDLSNQFVHIPLATDGVPTNSNKDPIKANCIAKTDKRLIRELEKVIFSKSSPFRSFPRGHLAFEFSLTETYTEADLKEAPKDNPKQLSMDQASQKGIIYIDGSGPTYATATLLAKVLANRLKKVLDKVVSGDQNAFVRGKQILDASLIANEVIDFWHKRNEKGLIKKKSL
ncbi:hypothetical protein CK203_036058 [Vitis vinifera]|uniref:Histone deacetylase n=1 Tax=Vitis vinifera TaxID=29760 RepID=A0A438HR06_VITVI|nr:hypothetical protein CK203_036058 [Vitis vinifera]